MVQGRKANKVRTYLTNLPIRDVKALCRKLGIDIPPSSKDLKWQLARSCDKCLKAKEKGIKEIDRLLNKKRIPIRELLGLTKCK